MKRILAIITLIAATNSTYAQKSAEDSIKAVINNMFDGMRNADTTLFLSAFSETPVMQTISNRDGKTSIRNENVKEFASFVGKLKKDSADEKIIFETIKIDGPLAIVWTPYKFYHNGKFSHCGVNSFQLVRFNGVWRIQYLIDTRRRQGCE